MVKDQLGGLTEGVFLLRFAENKQTPVTEGHLSDLEERLPPLIAPSLALPPSW